MHPHEGEEKMDHTNEEFVVPPCEYGICMGVPIVGRRGEAGVLLELQQRGVL